MNGSSGEGGHPADVCVSFLFGQSFVSLSAIILQNVFCAYNVISGTLRYIGFCFFTKIFYALTKYTSVNTALFFNVLFGPPMKFT